uniref:Raptor_N domain-containing protein n=1 Tax=Rhabditophanes sp. KR3021 TaxID=114890 RepID=A0AC35TRU8_9BILA
MRTVSVALILSLNIGTEPPGAPKAGIDSRKLAGYDVSSGCGGPKLSQKIASAIQKNFERLQPRARYRMVCDTTTEEVKKLLVGIRRNAKEERVLVYYNGFGVPLPTDNGEVWVFDRHITKYIPLNVLEMMSWMKSPSVYIWDMHQSGKVPEKMTKFSEAELKEHLVERKKQFDKRVGQDKENNGALKDDFATLPMAAQISLFHEWNKETIHLAACGAEENLPIDSEVPVDIFTQCLTFPVQTSLFIHLYLHPELRERYGMHLIENLPGALSDRRTLLGELNWVFTAITDTIAFTTIPKTLFQKFFREDLLVASLFRSFLLATRVMKAFHCNAVSVPELPPTDKHELWRAWDHALDMCLMKLYETREVPDFDHWVWPSRKELFTKTYLKHNLLMKTKCPEKVVDYEYQFSSFFMEQLDAFKVWLKHNDRTSFQPQQLPVILQVLLSQAHRVSALELMARFLDLGEKAVKSAIDVGCFPYVLKLLQCFNAEIRTWLTFIWAKILAVFPAHKEDLLKEKRYTYFTNILQDQEMDINFKMVPAFVISTLILNEDSRAQKILTDNNYVSICLELFADPGINNAKMLILWLLVGLGRLWADCNDARWQAVRIVAYGKVLDLVDDDIPEVRAAAVYALGCFVRNKSTYNEHASTIDHEICDKLCKKCTYDGSELVRSELVVAIQWFVMDFESRFVKLFEKLNKKTRVHSFTSDGGLGSSLSPLSPSNVQMPSSNASLPDLDRHSPNGIKGFIVRSSSFFNRTNARNNLSTISERVRSSDSVGSINSIIEESSEYGNIDEKKKHLKRQILVQIEEITSKTFNEPLERVWLSILKLSLDPVEKVEDMAMTLFEYVKQKVEDSQMARRKTSTMSSDSNFLGTFNRSNGNYSTHVSSLVKVAEHEALSDEKNGNPSAKFSIGSPSTPAIHRRIRQVSQCSTNSENGTDETKGDISNGNSPADAYDVPLSSGDNMGYTPKRRVFAKIATTIKIEENDSGQKHQALVKTDFIERCANKFKEPILDDLNMGWIKNSAHRGSPNESKNDNDSSKSIDLGMDLARDPAVCFVSEKIVDHSIPSDWADHMSNGLRQKGSQDSEKLKSSRATADKIKFSIKADKKIHCMAFSNIRPHLYCSDANSIRIIDWEMPYSAHYSSRTKRIIPVKNDAFTSNDMSKLMVINETTREMVISGSHEGLFKVFDPGYSIHSHELNRDSQMLTASYVFNDKDRINVSNKKDKETLIPNTTYYE